MLSIRELALEFCTMLDKLQNLTSEKKIPKEIKSPSSANNNTDQKNYYFLDCYRFEKLEFYTNLLAKLLLDSFLLDSLLSDNSISQSHANL